MFSRKCLQKATLQMKSMATKKINWDLYSWTLIFSKNIFFKSPCSGLSCLSLFWALLSTAQIVHHIFCEHLENWNVHFLHNSSLLLSIFRLVWLFYEANSLVNFVNVFFLCVQNRQKKTIQPKQLSIAGWYNEENTFLREHSLKSSFWDICVYVCMGKPVWFIEFRTWTFPWLPIQAQNLWLLFPLALILLLSSRH